MQRADPSREQNPLIGGEKFTMTHQPETLTQANSHDMGAHF
jgi:hypothetical protein